MLKRTSSIAVACLFAGALLNGQEPASRMIASGTSESPAPTTETATFRAPALGVRLTMTKTVDPATGVVHGEVRDQAGRLLDYPAVRAAEIAARQQSPSMKLSTELRRELTQPGNRPLPLIAWLRYDAAALDAAVNTLRRGINPATASEEELRAMEAAITDAVAQRNTEVVMPFAASLEQQGLVVRYISRLAPAVFFDAPASLALELAERVEIDTLYLETAACQDDNGDANRTHRTDRVHEYGVRGRGVRVAMLEDNGVDPACPHLNIAGWFNAGTPDPDNHIHGTSGCVASQLASRLGCAPDVTLYSANATTYSDSDITAAGDWIGINNMDVTNMSFGPTVPSGNLRYVDRYIDYQARSLVDSYVASAGNSGIGSLVGNVGWNMLSVGAHTDGGNGNWDGDVMSSFSATADPTTGCEKPNLASNGQDVDTLGEGPGWLTDDYDGTSFSAPFVTGNLANAMVASGTATLYPEAAMALMMATAWHNIEGAERLSEEDGAGGLHGLAAYRAAAAGRIYGTSVSSTSFNTNGYYTHNIYLQGGDPTRVAIAWFSQANAAYTTDTLNADLDISIYAGQNQTSGSYYGGSFSFNNNFEIVQFTPPTTGWYTIAVNDYAFAGTSEGLGFAWSQKYADTSSFRLMAFTTETGVKAGPTIGNGSYWMDFRAPNSPSASYICAPSATMVNGFPFSPATWSPLDIDVWTTVWFDQAAYGINWWNGFAGTLSASGSTIANRMSIPDAPFLIGLTLHHIGFTLGAGWPDGIKELSEVHSFKFWPEGVVHAMTDDSTFEQQLPFGFRFFGTNYTSCWVNSNGNVTFGASDTDYSESVAELLAGSPRIAFAWDDFNPGINGVQGAPVIRVREIFQGEQAVVIEFLNVTEFGATNANSFRLTLADDNSITMEYADCDLADAIVGISPGNGLSAAAEVDLSSNGLRVSGTNGALFEQFGGGADSFDLGNTSIYWNKLRFVPTNATANNYRLLPDFDR